MLDLVTFLLTGGYTPTNEEAQRPAHVTVETGVGVCLLVLCVLGVYVCLVFVMLFLNQSGSFI